MQLNLRYAVPFTEAFNEEGDFLIEGVAINETTTSNNHKFIAEELIPAASTLTGVPLLVDHENKVENIKGRVLGGFYNEMGKRVDFKARVMDKICQEMIKDGRLNSVSVGAMVRDCEEKDGELIPRGITFKELSLVAVPADSGATFSMALKEAYDTNPKEIKEVVTVGMCDSHVVEIPIPVDAQKGYEIERKEHPWLSDADVIHLVRDHMAEDEYYYDDYEEDKNEGETEDKAKLEQKSDLILVEGGQKTMSEEIAETAIVSTDNSKILIERMDAMAKELAELKASKVEEKPILRNEFEELDADIKESYKIVQSNDAFSYIANKY